MPALITLEEAKEFARLGDSEDTTLQIMIDAATAYVEKALNIGPLDSTAPSMAKQAALMILADMYDNRGAQSDRPLSSNKTVDTLLDLARNYEGYVQ